MRDKPWVGTVVPPGPDNPLGDYALYLGWPTYVIHGTNKPYGVGRRVSRGCIRMYPEGVERLFAEIPVGTPVTAVDQVTKLGWHMGELYLEAQPDFAQIDELEENQGITARPVTDEDRQRITERAGADAARIDWVVAEAELVKRSGLPVQITTSQLAGEGPGRVPPPNTEAAEARPDSPMSRGEGGIYRSPSAGFAPACPPFSRDIHRTADLTAPLEAGGEPLRHQSRPRHGAIAGRVPNRSRVVHSPQRRLEPP